MLRSRGCQVVQKTCTCRGPKRVGGRLLSHIKSRRREMTRSRPGPCQANKRVFRFSENILSSSRKGLLGCFCNTPITRSAPVFGTLDGTISFTLDPLDGLFWPALKPANYQVAPTAATVGITSIPPVRRHVGALGRGQTVAGPNPRSRTLPPAATSARPPIRWLEYAAVRRPVARAVDPMRSGRLRWVAVSETPGKRRWRSL
jgi:hypothetical protein